MQIHPLGVLWRRLAFIFYFLFLFCIFIYLFIHFIYIYMLLVARVSGAFLLLCGRHNMLFIIIKIFHRGLFAPV